MSERGTPERAGRLLAEVDRVLDAGRPQVAELLLAAIATTPVDPVRLALARARASLALHAPVEALARLASVMQAAPTSPELLLCRARARLAAGDARAACADAGRAAALDHSDAATGLHATLLMETGRIGEAACVLDAAIGEGSCEPALHVGLGVALLQLGEPRAARIAIARGQADHPRNADLARLSLMADARLAASA